MPKNQKKYFNEKDNIYKNKPVLMAYGVQQQQWLRMGWDTALEQRWLLS